MIVNQEVDLTFTVQWNKTYLRSESEEIISFSSCNSVCRIWTCEGIACESYEGIACESCEGIACESCEKEACEFCEGPARNEAYVKRTIICNKT